MEPSGEEQTSERGPTDSHRGSFNFFLPDAVAPQVAAPLPLSARGLDLELISRVAGCELAFALPPPLTTPQPCLPSLSLFTCSASRRQASALWHANAPQAAMWFDKRAMPKACINERILIFFNIIDPMQLFIKPQSATTAAQCATNGQAKKNSQSCRRSSLKSFCS